MSTYSPDKRTALLFSGTGAHGAYHAGVLRALQEAGVKIDVVAGHGIGAVAAALAAIDGGARLWEPNGLWDGERPGRFYRWRLSVRAAGWTAMFLVGVLLSPLLFLAVGLVIYPLGFILALVGSRAGADLIAWYSGEMQTAFAGTNLPTVVPRLAMIVLAVMVVMLLVSVIVARWRAPLARHDRGRWWWHIMGAPLDVREIREAVGATVWQLIRGAASEARPSRVAIGRRYADVLEENLGQPGFRELMIVAADLDTRSDVVAALLHESYRQDFVARRAGRERRAEVLDLAGSGREHAIDMVNSALTLPFACDPYLIAHSAESYWRGETHRLCDRPGAVARLLEELSAAGVSQVIVVSAIAAISAPHHLPVPRLDVRSRLGELLETSESAALRDAVENARLRFDAIHLLTPAHNPLGPFDFGGAYDERSDRRETLAELLQQGYEDAYHQFIEPVVGASGEHLAHQ